MYVCEHMWVCTYVDTPCTLVCMEVRWQPVGISSLLPPRGFQGLKPGHQSLQASPLICWASLSAPREVISYPPPNSLYKWKYCKARETNICDLGYIWNNSLLNFMLLMLSRQEFSNCYGILCFDCRVCPCHEPTTITLTNILDLTW